VSDARATQHLPDRGFSQLNLQFKPILLSFQRLSITHEPTFRIPKKIGVQRVAQKAKRGKNKTSQQQDSRCHEISMFHLLGFSSSPRTKSDESEKTPKSDSEEGADQKKPRNATTSTEEDKREK